MTDSLNPLALRNANRSRLAIIGGGSSGLICLKNAIDTLVDWEIVCFERSDRITGCWGNPYPGFVSTSTKYTTQFASFPVQDGNVRPDGGVSRSEFFCDAEYGQYLEEFAAKFRLHPYIRLGHQVDRVGRCPADSGWLVTFRSPDKHATSEPVTEAFDALVICTGLAAQAKSIDSLVPQIDLAQLNTADGLSQIRNHRIVIFGGGESAVDYAQRLSQPALANKVYLSLQSGVRVSPRYHPIRGVPSDFLRNRLMLSIHPDIRNWIGQRFVEARIMQQERFERWFPPKHEISTRVNDSVESIQELDEQMVDQARKEWAYRLTKAAKDELFNMFHNKSDDFLESVARKRIEIIGSPVDSSLENFHCFDSTDVVAVRPDRILPAIGYRSTLQMLVGDSIRLSDFYLGCCHQEYPDLFLIGFARPIIGNIPTISEMQAQWVCGLIAGRFIRPNRIVELNAANQTVNSQRYAKLNREAIYPVEMFPYCDALARLMNSYPSLPQLRSFRTWFRMQLSPATTMHYAFRNPVTREFFDEAPIYMPTRLVLLLLMLKPIDAIYRIVKVIQRYTTTRTGQQKA